MILPVVQFGDEILLKKSKPVNKKENLESLIENMIETMYLSKGIGLAAVQVGLLKNLFIIDIPEVTKSVMVFINPIIKKKSHYFDENEEGCLSIPGIKADIMRPSSILLNYQDKNFKTHEKVFDDILSVCIQHEIDHLNGILFLERIKKKDGKRIKKNLIEKKFSDKAIESIVLAKKNYE